MKKIKFSIALEGDKDLETYALILKKAESYGFYSLQIYEHIPFKPSMLIVSYLTKHIKRMKIGTVTIPFFLNDPLILARNIAFLQEATGNKILFGISRGAYASYLCTNIERNLKKFLDYMNCISCIFSNKEYKGKYYNFKPKQELNWISKEKPEIYIGTSGPKLCYEASKLDIVKGIVVDNLWNPDYARKMFDIIRKAISETQRSDDVELIARPFVYLEEDYQKAKRKMEKILNFYIPELVGNSPMLNLAKNRELEIEKLACIGSIKKIEKEIESMIKAGVTHICFGHPLGEDIIKCIEKLGKELIPSFTL